MVALLGDDFIGVDSLEHILDKVIVLGQKGLYLIEKDAAVFIDVHLLEDFYHGLVVEASNRLREEQRHNGLLVGVL